MNNDVYSGFVENAALRVAACKFQNNFVSTLFNGGGSGILFFVDVNPDTAALSTMNKLRRPSLLIELSAFDRCIVNATNLGANEGLQNVYTSDVGGAVVVNPGSVVELSFVADFLRFTNCSITALTGGGAGLFVVLGARAVDTSITLKNSIIRQVDCVFRSYGAGCGIGTCTMSRTSLTYLLMDRI